MSAVALTKPDLRRRLRRARRALSPSERVVAEAAIRAKVLPRALAVSGAVALYASAGSEVSLDAVAADLERAGRPTVFPRVKGAALVFHHARLDELCAGYRGLREPSESAAIAEWADIGAVIVPGLGFDSRGGRVGQGGGFYDRALADVDVRCLRVGVCFQIQIIAGLVPREPHDVSVDTVVTEHGVAQAGKWTLDSAPPTR